MKKSQYCTAADDGRLPVSGVSRREMIAAGGAMVAAATSSPLVASTALAQGGGGSDATLDQLRRTAAVRPCVADEAGRQLLLSFPAARPGGPVPGFRIFPARIGRREREPNKQVTPHSRQKLRLMN